VFGFVQDWYKVGRLLSDSVVRRKHTKYALLLGQLLFLESDRSKTMDELWENYGFILEKLRFRSVIFKTHNQCRTWKSKRQELSKHQRSNVQEIKANTVSEMVFSCDADEWDEETLRLLSELAAEAWLKAVVVWEKERRGTA
jgi:hypothetical protein